MNHVEERLSLPHSLYMRKALNSLGHALLLERLHQLDIYSAEIQWFSLVIVSSK